MAGTYNLTIEKYIPYEKVFTYTIDGVLVNLTGYTAAAQIRDVHDNFQVNLTVALGGALGTITISLTKEQSTALKAGNWDLILTPPVGIAKKLLKGSVEIESGVTRSGS